MGYADRRICRKSKVNACVMRNFLILALGLICSLNISAVDRVYYHDLILPKDSIKLVEIDSLSKSYLLEVRAALARNSEKAGVSKQKWGIVWNYISNMNYNYAIVQFGNSDFGDFLDKRYAEVSVGVITDGRDSLIYKKQFDKGLNMSVGENSFLLERENNIIKLFIGDKEYQYITSIHDNSIKGGCGIITTENLNITTLATESQTDTSKLLRTDWNIDTLDTYFSTSTDPIEGYWQYLDRDVDDTKARMGGRYRLAFVKDDNGYILIYISGAVTNADNWKCGMIKGRLNTTIFIDHYDLIWYDSMIEPIMQDAHADIKDNSIISLQFPLYKSTLRLSKER